ncbi:MAG: hypothetical protein K9M08_23990 [Pirellula sp.]|nr:hypothetical protein [Pirellula sp.]
MSVHDDDNRFESLEAVASEFSKLIPPRVRRRVTTRRAYRIDLEQLENDIHLDFIRQLVLHDWHSLTRRDIVAILWTIVDHQAIKAIEHENRLKRLCPNVSGQRMLETCIPDRPFGDGPEDLVDLEDFLSYLLRTLPQNQQRVFSMKRQGWSNFQISQELHSTIRTVQMILNAIEQTTRNELSKLHRPKSYQLPNNEQRTTRKK